MLRFPQFDSSRGNPLACHKTDRVDSLEQIIDGRSDQNPSSENRTIRRDILRLIIPIALENALQILANFVTLAMVGRLLAADIAAFGVGARIYNTCFALFRGIGIGATIQIATYFGLGAIAKCRRNAEQAYATAVPLSIVLAALCAIFPRQIVRVLTDDPVLLEKAAEFLRVSIWAIPFMAAITVNTAAFNGQNDTKTPMMIAGVLNVFNAAVSYVAIFGLGGFGGWGLYGAAIANVLSQAFGCMLGVALLYRKGAPFRRHAHGLRFFSPDLPALKSIYATGLPAAMESLLWQLSAVLVSKVILAYGSESYAAYQLGLQAEMFTEMPAAGFTVAAATLTANAIARRDGDLYRTYFRQLSRMALFVGASAMALLLVFHNPAMRLLTDKPELLRIGGVYLIYMAFSQIPQVLSKMFNGVIRSSGGKRVPMYIVFTGVWLIRVPLVILAGRLGLNIIWIWLIINLDQTVKLLLSLLYVWRMKLRHYVEQLQEEAFPVEGREPVQQAIE